AQLLLKAVEISADGGQDGRILSSVKLYRLLIAEEIQCHVLLTRQQVGSSHLGPQATRHHALKHAGTRNMGILIQFPHTFVNGPETQRIDTGLDQGEELSVLAIEGHVDIHDFPEFQTPEIDRCANLQAAHGLIEMEFQQHWLAVWVCHGLLPIVMKLEYGVGPRRVSVKLACLRKCNAACKNRGQRACLHRKTIGIERDIDSAGIPETGIRCHVPVVWCVHKDLDVDCCAVVVEVVAYDLAHLYAPEVNWRAYVEPAEILSL